MLLALAGSFLVADGCTRCWRRHVQCPPPSRAAPALVVATRVSERPHGTERSRPPQRREGGGWREVLRSTGTDVVQCRAAGCPEGSRAAGGSHGRLRGCPGAVAGCAAVGQHGRRGRGQRGPLLPPSAVTCRAEEGGGGRVGSCEAAASLAAPRATAFTHGRAAEPDPGLQRGDQEDKEIEKEEEEKTSSGSSSSLWSSLCSTATSSSSPSLRFSSSATFGYSCCAAETGSHCFLHTPGAVLGQGRCARVAQRQGYGQTVQIAVLVPQLQSIEGRRDPFRAAESDSHGLSGRKTIEAPQLQYVARWSMPFLRMSFLTCPSLCNDRCSWFR